MRATTSPAITKSRDGGVCEDVNDGGAHVVVAVVRTMVVLR
jgi:hypothetical protein